MDKPAMSDEDWEIFRVNHAKAVPPREAPPPPNGEDDYGFDGHAAPHEGKPNAPSRFTLVKFSKIQPLDSDDDYCVKKLLPRSGLVVVWGRRSAARAFGPSIY